MYTVPADAKYTRETFITEILKMQLTDGVNGNAYGGWVLGGYGSSSDVDITAMAIQALAPYYNDDTVYTYVNTAAGTTVSKTVRQCVDEALDRLGSMMNASAGFSSWNTNNAESIAQVIVALCALGIDPAADERFVTADGQTLLDGLLRFRVSDGRLSPRPRRRLEFDGQRSGDVCARRVLAVGKRYARAVRYARRLDGGDARSHRRGDCGH